jgi:hypothetical protein
MIVHLLQNRHPEEAAVAMCGRLFVMERDKFKTPKIRPYTASDISVTPEECHPDYQLVVQDTSVATDTAHLERFRLEPSDAKLPIVLRDGIGGRAR